MCAITGLISRNGNALTDSARQAVLSQLRHRGPDAQGMYVADGIFLGHRRLSIIDLDPRSDQPMQQDNLVISFNGEIYNYRALRRSLQDQGIQFRTESDTEVILACYRKDGMKCLQYLEGMFAFAIWDETTRMLVMARDKFGEKPLAYFLDGDRLAFASEIGALGTLVGREHLAIDERAIGLYFALTYIPAPRTPYMNMHQLEPGHWAQFDSRTWKLRGERYYWPGRNPGKATDLSFEEASARLRQQVEESVRLRIQSSDVPVATFLSGGIDSSIVTAVAARQSDLTVHAYSVSFPEDPGFDESQFASEVARRYPKVRHTVVPITQANLLGFTDQTLCALGEPYADASIVPTAFLCSHVEEKVILGGDGADEIFAGYGVYSAMQFTARLPQWLKFLARYVPRPGNAHAISNPRLRAATLFLDHVRVSPIDEYFSWRTYAQPNEIAALGLDAHGMSALQAELMPWPLENLRDILIADIAFNLHNDMLKKVDLASMQHSLEVRLPYLDSALVEFALSMPASYLIQGGERKSILRHAFRDLIPRQVLGRRKQGFLLPIREWFQKGRLREELIALAKAQGLIDPGAVLRYLTRHGDGAQDYSTLLWSTYTFLKWQSHALRPA